jgi:uncharacterized protein (TIGR03067 family)
MCKATWLTATVLLLAGAPATAAPATELEGTWEATAATTDGKEMPAEELKFLKLTVRGDRYTYEEMRTVERGTLKVFPAKTPKQLQLTRSVGGFRDGIYERKGDTLKLCFNRRGANTPKEFDAGAGTGNQLTVWRKVK